MGITRVDSHRELSRSFAEKKHPSIGKEELIRFALHCPPPPPFSPFAPRSSSSSTFLCMYLPVVIVQSPLPACTIDYLILIFFVLSFVSLRFLLLGNAKD